MPFKDEEKGIRIELGDSLHNDAGLSRVLKEKKNSEGKLLDKNARQTGNLQTKVA
jgi:hypothetical protein